MITLYIVVVAIGLIASIVFFARDAGKDKAENKVMEDTLDDIMLAKQARDALDASPAVRKRVREKFTRK